jgi:hypothetical protein
MQTAFWLDGGYAYLPYRNQNPLKVIATVRALNAVAKLKRSHGFELD